MTYRYFKKPWFGLFIRTIAGFFLIGKRCGWTFFQEKSTVLRVGRGCTYYFWRVAQLIIYVH